MSEDCVMLLHDYHERQHVIENSTLTIKWFNHAYHVKM